MTGLSILGIFTSPSLSLSSSLSSSSLSLYISKRQAQWGRREGRILGITPGPRGIEGSGNAWSCSGGEADARALYGAAWADIGRASTDLIPVTAAAGAERCPSSAASDPHIRCCLIFSCDIRGAEVVFWLIRRASGKGTGWLAGCFKVTCAGFYLPFEI
ncbi:hypothetical protein E2C01_083162 [Portunus trituberculatus]|uniref:Uncharacterized protein n=1 Tax=Portunus trituberculatus TaxID=210409 RepID=A0A5B7IWG9_PORTR|nr:hypothetical protein [Portunus trituberculatus]